MSPRSQTLFHFTKSVDSLKSILKNGFWPRYCLEEFDWHSPKTGHISYPMVCFCDIPLTRIGEHVAFYGQYGLGMTKQWTKTNGLNPLIYISPSTSVSTALARLLNCHKVSLKDINSIISYVKPVERNIKHDATQIPYQFYQENEWRYIPTAPEIPGWITKEEYSDKKLKTKFNKVAKKHGTLQITPNDIKYIFVKSDADIPEIIDFIQVNLKQNTVNDINILMSRVISLESINADL